MRRKKQSIEINIEISQFSLKNCVQIIVCNFGANLYGYVGVGVGVGEVGGCG